LTGLSKGTRYYYGVSSSNAVPGTTQSKITVLETLYTPPVIESNGFITYVTSVSANLPYTIREYGGPNITETGVCYSTSPNPTVNDARYVMDTTGLGYNPRFTTIYGTLTNLAPNTKYHARAYARNPAGVTYTNETVFTTLENGSCFQKPLGIPTTTVRDDNVRDIKVIGGNLMFAGNFKHVNGFTGSSYAAKTSLDGTYSGGWKWADPSFRFTGSNFEPLTDGGILMAVESNYSRVVRMKPDGSFDPAFFAGGTNWNALIFKFQLLSDGRILVAGSFQTYNGDSAHGLVRLTANGSTDPGFRYSLSMLVKDIHALPDGRIIAVSDGGIVRLNSNGSLDGTYRAALDDISTTAFSPVKYSMRLPDNELLVAYTDRSGSVVIVRLKSDGSVDPSFSKATLNTSSMVTAMGLAVGGGYLIGGDFNGINGRSARTLVRLNSDGSMDQSLDAGSGFNAPPYSILDGNDGFLYIGGKFTAYRGKNANYIIKIRNDGTSCQ
jgi:uncharacterized delta-60 repeat protein